MKAYTEKNISDKKIRTFKSSLNSHDLKWHCDKFDRIISVKNNTDWKFQYDNCLPIMFEKSKKYFIPKKTFHRLIKGNNDLVIEIQELNK
jgi:hypothetical protein